MREDTRPLGRCAVDRVHVSACGMDGCDSAALSQRWNWMSGDGWRSV